MTTSSPTSDGSSTTGSETTTSGTTGGLNCGDGLAEEGEVCFIFIPGEYWLGDMIAVADLNEDGKLDVIAATNNVCPASPAPGVNLSASPPSGTPMNARCTAPIWTYEGDGLGSFTLHVEESVEPGVATLAAADVNGDGHVDLVTAETWLQLFPGMGDGTFAPPVLQELPLIIKSIALDDVNSDGNVDIVGVGPNGIVVMFGDGIGGFTPTPVFGGDDGPGRIKIILYDLDDDNNLDLLTLRWDIAGWQIERWLGVGDGSFTKVMTTTFDTSATQFSVVEPTPPARPYVVALEYGEGIYSLLGLMVHDDGMLGPAEIIAADTRDSLAIGRFDSGLSEDAILYSWSKITALHGEVPWPSPPELILEGIFDQSVEAPTGDFNGDGLDDLVLMNGVLLSNP